MTLSLFCIFADSDVIIISFTQNIMRREGEQASLVCQATGKPTPSINWTRNGVIVHSGSPYNTSVLTYNDNGACYTCIAYNGVGDTKTATSCLNVLCKYHVHLKRHGQNTKIMLVNFELESRCVIS